MPGALHARGGAGKALRRVAQGYLVQRAIAKLQREHNRLQDRIDTMYVDKLDGRIDNDFFDR